MLRNGYRFLSNKLEVVIHTTSTRCLFWNIKFNVTLYDYTTQGFASRIDEEHVVINNCRDSIASTPNTVKQLQGLHMLTKPTSQENPYSITIPYNPCNESLLGDMVRDAHAMRSWKGNKESQPYCKMARSRELVGAWIKGESGFLTLNPTIFVTLQRRRQKSQPRIVAQKFVDLYSENFGPFIQSDKSNNIWEFNHSSMACMWTVSIWHDHPNLTMEL